MSLRINLNSASLTAHRTLSATDAALSKSIERLSSGFRINSAGDDPAGLVISEKLRAQVSGLGQAIRNAGDAVNMVKTAEGALNEVHRLLRSMRDLAVHAANTGATDAASVAADQAQIENAIRSLNKIAAETMFGQKTLLDGSAGIKATVIGSSVISADFSYATGLADGDQISINVTSAATKGVVYSKAFTGESDTIGASGTFYVNGVGISYTTNTTVAQLRSAINAVSSETGVVAAQTTAGTIDFTTTRYGHSAVVALSDAGHILSGVVSASDNGSDAAAQVTVGSNNVSDALWASGDGLVLKDSLGNQIVLTEAAGTNTGNKGAQFQVSVGTLSFQVGAYAGQTRELNIPDVHAYNLGTATYAGESVAKIDVTTAEGARQAIEILDEAISTISTIRANLGATQKNVLESSINSLTIAKENIAASESTIRDTDMAAEMVEFTKYQILQQAGVAMLAQANQAPQALLVLLR
ncbi:MAG: flagellin N-terminal helical domain-containing protein [Armatimonadota bacterium]